MTIQADDGSEPTDRGNKTGVGSVKIHKNHGSKKYHVVEFMMLSSRGVLEKLIKVCLVIYFETLLEQAPSSEKSKSIVTTIHK